MAITVNDNFQNNSPKPLDNKYYKSGLTPYASVSEANTTIVSAYRYRGLTVAVLDSGTIKEYWYYAGITNGDLVEKLPFIPNTRSINTNSTLTGGGALTSDLTLGVVNNTSIQKIQVRTNTSGAYVGSRKALNVIAGTNITVTAADGGDTTDEINLTINATGGGGGGYTPVPHVVTTVAESNTFTVGAIVGAAEIYPVAMMYPTGIKIQTTDNTPAAGEFYLNTATGQFTLGGSELIPAGQDIALLWWTS